MKRWFETPGKQTKHAIQKLSHMENKSQDEIHGGCSSFHVI